MIRKFRIVRPGWFWWKTQGCGYERYIDARQEITGYFEGNETVRVMKTLTLGEDGVVREK